MPFRFTTAIEILKDLDNNSKMLSAISKALDLSLKNVPILKGKTAVILDESGSMSGKPWQIGTLFAAMLMKTNDCDLITFATNARYQNVNTNDSISTIVKNMECNGGGTNMASAIQLLNKKYDRIIILSDMQTWLETEYDYSTKASVKPTFILNKYILKYGIAPVVYSWDLEHSGTMQFPEKDVICLAGFSDRVFDIIRLMEEDKDALINKIQAIPI
jgi:hypothetical protein